MEKKIEDLPKTKSGKMENAWWTKELEIMARDSRIMRREGNEEWKTARKVFRNTMIRERYENMKKSLGNMKDRKIFRAIKELEGRRAIPLIRNPDRSRVFENEEISDLIIEQLNPTEENDTENEERYDIEITEEEIDYGIKTSPANTATGIDSMSYPMIRFWIRKDKEKCGEAIKRMAVVGCKDWKKAKTVLIKKGDKDSYDVVISWRMIHLLPILSKMVDRVVLNKLVKTVRLEETHYGSRKDRSTHDVMKQILEFLEYNKDKYTGILSMDVEGGFDKVDIDKLCDILVYRECERRLVDWIRRGTKGQRIQL